MLLLIMNIQMYKHIDRVRNLFLFFIELATWWVLVSESEWKFYYKWYKKTIMQSKECTNIRARPSRATHIPLPSLCVTHLFFISIFVIKWLRISYTQSHRVAGAEVGGYRNLDTSLHSVAKGKNHSQNMQFNQFDYRSRL